MRFPSPAAWIIVAAAVLLAASGCGGDESEPAADKGQIVRFQKPTDKGPDPFTKPADVRGSDKVDVGSGPFGGTGSDLVCDRELLIRSLRARPDRLREWARVLRIDPTYSAVARYIRKLRPVTLTQDTRVTNHSFVNGRAVGFQAILQAGTAVLVDKDGKPVARCRCGNPLLEPVEIPVARCYGCPPRYEPPPPCDYYDYDDSDYNRYDDTDYERSYDASDYRDKCYTPYPDPPSTRYRRKRAPPAEPAQTPTYTAPAPTTTEEPALDCENPRSQLEFEQCHPPQEQPSEPQRDPNYQCDVAPEQPGFQPPAHPGEDWLRNCG